MYYVSLCKIISRVIIYIFNVQPIDSVESNKKERGTKMNLRMKARMTSLKAIMTREWESEPGKPRKDFKGEYSELLAAGRTKDFPTMEDFLAAIQHNRQVAIEKCGFDKRLLKKFQRNGITTLGQVRELQERSDYHDMNYTRKQKDSIGAFIHDTRLYYKE